MVPCYFDHKMSMCRDFILVCLICIPSYRNLDKSAETHCRTKFPNIVSKCFDKLLFLRNNSLKSRQKLWKFELFGRIFHPRRDNDRHWSLHTPIWNVWWIINKPCRHFDLWSLFFINFCHADTSTFDRFFSSIFFFFTSLLTSLLKFSTSHSVKVLKLCPLISSRIIAVINTMSTCQSVLATRVKTSNGA